MAYHRDHVTRFIQKSGIPAKDAEEIRQRMETVIAEFSSKDKGVFSGGKLSEVLGNPDLVRTFDDMWEKGQLHH